MNCYWMIWFDFFLLIEACTCQKKNLVSSELMNTIWYVYELPFDEFVWLWLYNDCIGSFYTAAPLSLCTFCVLEAFNFAADQVAEFKLEGQEMVSFTDFDLWGYMKPLTRLGWCQWAGAVIFAWGWFHQLRCHAILVCVSACLNLSLSVCTVVCWFLRFKWIVC